MFSSRAVRNTIEQLNVDPRVLNQDGAVLNHTTEESGMEKWMNANFKNVIPGREYLCPRRPLSALVNLVL